MSKILQYHFVKLQNENYVTLSAFFFWRAHLLVLRAESCEDATRTHLRALARHEGIEVVQVVAHGQRTHVRVDVYHHHKRAPPRLILAPVRSSDGVPAAAGAVLALAAAGPMREHYAGASARAIVEQLRRSSS